MRVLIVTKLFPNAAEPLAVPFNRLQFGALAAQCDVTLLATIPWFPGARWLGQRTGAGRLSDVPAEEWMDGLRVQHPRVMLVPRFGHRVSGLTYAASLLASVRRMRGQVDVVLGSWAYPDGMAAVLLARTLGVPSVVKVHGSDVNVLSTTRSTQRNVRWTLRHAHALIAPSQSLAEAVGQLGVPSNRVTVVRNGLDRERFRVRDRGEARRLVGVEPSGTWIVYVGRLELTKGVSELAQAFEELAATHPEARLAWVGDGSAREVCEALRRRLPERVKCAGACAHDQVADWLSAADVVTLPSYQEGMPNTVLEALASGRRVVATAVGGVPSVVHSSVLGELVPPRDARALRDALSRALTTPYEPAEVARSVRLPSWTESARQLREVLAGAVASVPALIDPGRGAPACERSW